MLTEKDFLKATGCLNLDHALELIELLKKNLYKQILETALFQYGLNKTKIN